MWYRNIADTTHRTLVKNQGKKRWSTKKCIDGIVIYKKYTWFSKRIGPTIKTNIITPEILCQIEKIEDLCGLYIVKCGEIGLLMFCIL